jgi:hypothetical protein
LRLLLQPTLQLPSTAVTPGVVVNPAGWWSPLILQPARGVKKGKSSRPAKSLVRLEKTTGSRNGVNYNRRVTDVMKSFSNCGKGRASRLIREVSGGEAKETVQIQLARISGLVRTTKNRKSTKRPRRFLRLLRGKRRPLMFGCPLKSRPPSCIFAKAGLKIESEWLWLFDYKVNEQPRTQER